MRIGLGLDIGMTAAMGGGGAYWQKILNTQAANLIGLWRMNETTGAAAIDSSPQGNDGTYSNVTLANTAGPDGIFVPQFVAASNSYMNYYSAGWASDFNKNEGTMGLWLKVAATFWEGATAKVAMSALGTLSEDLLIGKATAANYLEWKYSSKFIQLSGQSDTDWMFLLLTWSQTANAIKAYKDGIQVGTTQTFVTDYGTPFSSGCVIGMLRKDLHTSPIDGWAGLGMMWKVALSATEVLALANP